MRDYEDFDICSSNSYDMRGDTVTVTCFICNETTDYDDMDMHLVGHDFLYRYGWKHKARVIR